MLSFLTTMGMRASLKRAMKGGTPVMIVATDNADFVANIVDVSWFTVTFEDLTDDELTWVGTYTIPISTIKLLSLDDITRQRNRLEAQFDENGKPKNVDEEGFEYVFESEEDEDDE